MIHKYLRKMKTNQNQKNLFLKKEYVETDLRIAF